MSARSPIEACAVAVAQHADHAGLADAAMHLDAPFLQLPRDEVGGAGFLQAEFRMRVDIAADRGQFVVEAGIDRSGTGDLTWYRFMRPCLSAVSSR